jgi:carbon monoxide dehydrogenase subunit G
MSLEVEEKFQVRAPVERVWQFLLDPQQVVTCLPGAELTEVLDARNFVGSMKVKVGPVTVVYKGKLQLTEIDATAHRVMMIGEGTEKNGGGSVRLSMQSVVRAIDGDGGAEVAVSSTVDLVGRLVQLGRGMMLGVARQLFKQFSDRARAQLEAAVASPPVAEPLPHQVAATPAAVEKAPVEPVRALPLLFSALFSAFARWLRRLFAKKAG